MIKVTYKKPRTVLLSARTGKFTDGQVIPVINGVHVVPRGATRWAVKTMAPKSIRVFESKKIAIACATKLASSKHSVIYVHRRDGRVTTRTVASTKARASA